MAPAWSPRQTYWLANASFGAATAPLAPPARPRPPAAAARADRPATEVDGERHHLRLVLLLEPGDGDGRIESAGVGEHDLVHETGASVSWAAASAAVLSASNRSSQPVRLGSSGNSTMSVLSPATVPTNPSRVDSSIAWAM